VWRKLTPEGDPMPTGGKRLAYLDPELGVVVVLDGTTVWAYRYQRWCSWVFRLQIWGNDEDEQGNGVDGGKVIYETPRRVVIRTVKPDRIFNWRRYFLLKRGGRWLINSKQVIYSRKWERDIL
jgi:hypothetical protein